MRLLALLLLAAAVPAQEKPPLLVFLNATDPGTWEQLAAQRGWRFVTNSLPPTDTAVKTLETQVREAVARFGADPARVYLAGEGTGTPAVFLAVSRLPDIWTAALAVQGNVRPAIQSNRLFGANTQLVPLLWYTAEPNDRLAAAGFHVEVRPPQGATAQQALDWLAEHRRDPFPANVDCETGNPAFARCYWIEITGFDISKRNDVLASTRVNPGSGASLSVGPFGYDAGAPGPGIEVAWLPPDYRGLLKLKDRIVSVGGKPVADAREYVALMEATVEEKPAALIVQRGNKRERIEARIVLPKRDETVTARVQGAWIADAKEVQIISRGVSRLRVKVPAPWAPAEITWNGMPVAKAEAGGCWDLSIEKDPPSASPCETR